MRDPAADEERRKNFLSAAEVKALWEERLVSLQCATGNGDLFIPQLAFGVPGWFKAFELGLAFDAAPSILTTVFGSPDQPSLRAANKAAKKTVRDRENEIVKAFNAEAKSKGLRSYAKPVGEARGCSGCLSCVHDTRLRPLRALDHGVPRTWRPYSKRSTEQSVRELLHAGAKLIWRIRRRERAEQESVLSLLRTGAAAIRRARREEQSATKRQRTGRHDGSRAQMQARREKNQMRTMARRAGVLVVEGKLVREGGDG